MTSEGAVAADLPQLRRRVVAENGTGARGKHGGQHLALARKRAVADGVHALVAAMEEPTLGPLADAVVRQPRGDQLVRLDDSVLPFREPRDLGVEGCCN